MPAADEAGRSPSPGRRALLAQVAGLLAVGAALGALVPGAGVAVGLAGGLLASAFTAGTMLLRAWWRRTSRAHPLWRLHGPELLARELTRAGVGILAVLFLLGPFALGSGPLPTWVLVAATAGAACSLPLGVLVELRLASTAGGVPARQRMWRGALGAAGTAALFLSLVAVLAGLLAWQRAVAWTAVALATLALTAWARDLRGRPPREVR